MYILIELVPVAAGTGFGALFGILLLLFLPIIVAMYAMTCLLAPVGIVMELLENGTMWWILPAVLVVGAIINWICAKVKDGLWCAFMPELLTLALANIVVIVALIIEGMTKGFSDGEKWTLLLTPIFIVFYIFCGAKLQKKYRTNKSFIRKNKRELLHIGIQQHKCLLSYSSR